MWESWLFWVDVGNWVVSEWVIIGEICWLGIIIGWLVGWIV